MEETQEIKETKEAKRYEITPLSDKALFRIKHDIKDALESGIFKDLQLELVDHCLTCKFTSSKGSKTSLKFIYPTKYPFYPIKVYFDESIPNHPYVSNNGFLRFDYLNKDEWRGDVRLLAILLEIDIILCEFKVYLHLQKN